MSAALLAAQAKAHRAHERAARETADAHRELAEAFERAAREVEHAPQPATAVDWLPLRRCGLPKTTARRLAREGTLRSSRVGRDLLVNAADVARYIESRRVHAPHVDDGDEFDRAVARAANGNGARRGAA